MDYEVIEKTPSAEEYNQLRKSVGWGICDDSIVENSLKNSLYCVCVYHGDRIVGMGRVIGDNGLYYYLQDIIVDPGYHGKGIGGKVMDTIMAYVHRHSSHNSIIGLMSATGKENLYAKYGFVKRPNDYLGCGMTICIDKTQNIKS